MLNFKDNMQLYVLKMTVLKKLPPACEWILQIWPLGTELWDKTFNFEDNIGLLLPKMIVWKTQPLLVNEFFQFWTLGMESWNKIFNFEDSIWLMAHKMIVCKNIWPLSVKELLKSDHLEQSYRIKYWILKIT